jgi:hypothetical protein
VNVNPTDEIGLRLRSLREQFHQASFRYNPYSHSLFEYGEAVADVINSTPEAMLPFYRWAHGFPAGPTYLVEGNMSSDLFGWYMRPRPASRRLGDGAPQSPPDPYGRDDLVRARAEFGGLARAAWRCVAALPPEARGLFPGAREDRRVEAFLGGARVAEGTERLIDPSGVLEAHLWLLALHRIGWRTHRETPGVVQAVRPSLWEWRVDRFVEVAGEDASGVKAMWAWVESNSVFDPRDRSVPDIFVSDLPYNIFQTSAYAIDWILSVTASAPRQLLTPVTRIAELDSGEAVPATQNAEEARARTAPPGAEVTPHESSPQSPKGKSDRQGKQKKYTKAQAEEIVKKAIIEFGYPTLKDIYDGYGLPRSSAKRTDAWDSRPRRETGRLGLGARTLGDGVKALAAPKTWDDSATGPETQDDIAGLDHDALEKILQRAEKDFLSGCDKKAKADYSRLTDDERRNFLMDYVKQTGGRKTWAR